MSVSRSANDGLAAENNLLREELERSQVCAYNQANRLHKLIEDGAALQNENRILKQQIKRAKEALGYA